MSVNKDTKEDIEYYAVATGIVDNNKDKGKKPLNDGNLSEEISLSAEGTEKVQTLKEAWQVLDENKIDWDGKVFHNASLQSKKIDRRTFLKILAALSILAIAVKFGVDIFKPEFGFINAKKAAKDVVQNLIEQKKYFGENNSLPAQIDESNKIGFEKLIMDIMSYSQNTDGNNLSRDQAIFTISLCDATTNLYEAYYGKNFENYITCFSTYADVAIQSYENYMQNGKPVPNHKNESGYGARGINYAEGIGNIEERMNSLKLQAEEKSGKSL